MLLRILISLLRLAGRFRRDRGLASVRSVLIVELTRMGDVLSMLPAVRFLAGYFSKAHLTLLVDDQYAALLRALNLPVDVYGAKRPETLTGFLQSVQRVRKLNADLALSMSPPKRNVALTLMSGAQRKVGYLTYHDSITPYLATTPIEAVGCGLTRRAAYGRDHIEERSLEICRALGIETEHIVRSVELEASRYETARSDLIRQRVLPRRPFVVFHPFSGWAFRSWPLERFVELGRRFLCEAPKYEVVFLCEKAEEQDLRAAAERYLDSQSAHVFASDDLLMTAVLLKEAALFVGNDSGPLHLASALGTPVVGLFGPASPALTAPRADRAVFHYQKVECSPCDQRACVQPDRWCMMQISVDTVLRSVVAQLSVHSVDQVAANVEG